MNPDLGFDFRVVFDSLPSPYMVMNAAFEIVAANEAYLDVTLRTRESLIGANVFSAFPSEGESRRILQESFKRVRDQGVIDVIPVLPYAIPQAGGFVERSWSCTHVPIFGADGKVAFILQSTQDISQLKQSRSMAQLFKAAEEPPAGDVFERMQIVDALNHTLLATVHHLHRLFMNSPNFMCVLGGPDHIFEMANLAFRKLAGQRDLANKTLLEAMPEIADQGYLNILDNVFATGETFVGSRTRLFLKNEANDGFREYFLDLVIRTVMNSAGAPTGVLVEGCDVTDHVLAEQRQALLIRELHHRVRNTLATVQGVMNTTAKTSATIEEFQEAFAGRISTLAKTHAMMTDELKQSVSFLQLLNQELGPHADDRGLRIRLIGPSVNLPSQIAVPVSMAIHELAVNAVQHGALTAEQGSVEVEWRLIEANGGPALFCEWREWDGPIVRPPSRQGFGTMLLQRVLSQQIKAELQIAFDPEGFRLRMTIPLRSEH